MKKEELIKYIKYSIGGGVNLALKIGIVAVFDIFTIPAYLNYLITQVIILFSSYIYHSKVTFNEKMDFTSLFVFTKCVVGLKIVDYLLFNVNVYIFHAENIYAVIISTGVTFVLRYLLMDKYVFTQGNDNEKDMPDRCNNIR
jgi:putative flippase GtrA